jgi:hypothetical protein
LQAKKSAVVFVVAASAGIDAEIVVTAEIDIVVGRIAIFVDVFDVLEIAEIVIAAEIRVSIGILLLLDFLDLSTGSGFQVSPHSMQLTGSSLPRS